VKTCSCQWPIMKSISVMNQWKFIVTLIKFWLVHSGKNESTVTQKPKSNCCSWLLLDLRVCVCVFGFWTAQFMTLKVKDENDINMLIRMNLNRLCANHTHNPVITRCNRYVGKCQKVCGLQDLDVHLKFHTCMNTLERDNHVNYWTLLANWNVTKKHGLLNIFRSPCKEMAY
jgi:hypothetical protein